MNTYKFSVLMSVYIKENPVYLSDALKSNLIEQTLVPDEFVLVCDGKLTDDLYKVIENYKKDFPQIIKVYQLEENVGLGKALEFGLSQCSYAWVARADSDDICDRTRFEVQMSFLKENKNIDIVSSYIDEFQDSYKEPVQKKQLPLNHEELVEFAKFRNPINHMSVVFNKTCILNAGSYKHLPYIEDYFLWIRAIEQGARLANIDKYLVHARIGNGMMIRRSNREYIKSWKTLNKYMKNIGFINGVLYCRNMIAIRGFIYTPVKLKAFIYKRILRR